MYTLYTLKTNRRCHISNHIRFRNDIQIVRNEKKPKSMSQTELANKVGIRRDELSIIENGHRLPTKEILLAIKKELNCLASDLYSLELQKIIMKK